MRIKVTMPGGKAGMVECRNAGTLEIVEGDITQMICVTHFTVFGLTQQWVR